MVNGAGNLLSYYRPHRTTYKVKVHTRDGNFLTVHFSVSAAYSIFQACRLLSGNYTVRVWFRIHKLQRVARGQVRIQFRKLVIVKKYSKVFFRTNAVVVVTLNAGA